MGLADLPQSKWGAAGQQVILKGDFDKIEDAIIESFDLRRPPSLAWVNAGSLKVAAASDAPARAMLNGFPNLAHPGQFLSGGLSDGKYRVVTADVTLAMASNLWGTEKVSQWYAVLAIAGDADAAFTLKAMPWLRVQGEVAQVISCGLNLTPATDNDYGFTNDEFIGAVLHVVSGAQKGQLRAITANNVASSTSTITYSGTALSLSAGDWFIILPATNFKFLGSVFNDSSGDLVQFSQVGDRFFWPTPITNLTYTGDVRAACPLATEFRCGTVYTPTTVFQATIDGICVGWSVIDDVTAIGPMTATYTYMSHRQWVPLVNCLFTGSASLVRYDGYGYGYPAGYLA